jgi:hypothetical protein
MLAKLGVSDLLGCLYLPSSFLPPAAAVLTAVARFGELAVVVRERESGEVG